MHGVPEQPESQPLRPSPEHDDALPSPGIRIPKPDIEPPPALPDPPTGGRDDRQP